MLNRRWHHNLHHAALETAAEGADAREGSPFKYIFEDRGERDGREVLVRHENFEWRNGEQSMSAVTGGESAQQGCEDPQSDARHHRAERLAAEGRQHREAVPHSLAGGRLRRGAHFTIGPRLVQGFSVCAAMRPVARKGSVSEAGPSDAS
jgi:hypothetical protein